MFACSVVEKEGTGGERVDGLKVAWSLQPNERGERQAIRPRLSLRVPCLPPSTHHTTPTPAPAMSNTYAPVPSSSPPSSPRSSTSTLPPRTRAPPAPTVSFDRPHVPSYQRALLLAAIAVLFWLAFHLGAMGDGNANKVDVGAGGKAAGVLDQFGRQVKEKYGGEVVHAKRSVRANEQASLAGRATESWCEWVGQVQCLLGLGLVRRSAAK